MPLRCDASEQKPKTTALLHICHRCSAWCMNILSYEGRPLPLEVKTLLNIMVGTHRVIQSLGELLGCTKDCHKSRTLMCNQSFKNCKSQQFQVPFLSCERVRKKGQIHKPSQTLRLHAHMRDKKMFRTVFDRLFNYAPVEGFSKRPPLACNLSFEYHIYVFNFFFHHDIESGQYWKGG